MSSSLKRVATALIAAPIALAAIFLLPPIGFFLFSGVVVQWVAIEYVRVLRPAAPGAPLGALLVAILPVAGAMAWILSADPGPAAADVLLVTATLGTVGLGSLVLFARTPLTEVVPALGIIGFGTGYFALPLASLYVLQRADPWILFLGIAIIWLGDSAAYFVGSAIGSHRMAPVVSPKKSWEGALASVVTGLLVTGAWGWWRLGTVSIELLAVGLVTALAAAAGDLVESLFKRAVAVKDSGSFLPGHGGFYDRLDATLFGLPVLLLGLRLIGFDLDPS